MKDDPTLERDQKFGENFFCGLLIVWGLFYLIIVGRLLLTG